MMNPCENCKRKDLGKCHAVCYPRKDFLQGQRKQARKARGNNK